MMIWQDRNMSECFKVFYMKLYVHSLVEKFKWNSIKLILGSYTINYRHIPVLAKIWQL